MSQATRNVIYGAVTGIFGVLVILGVVDKATQDQAINILNAGLDLVPQVIGFATALLAFIKSLPSKVTTINVPRSIVDKVVTTSGLVLAGPSNAVADNTPLNEHVVSSGAAD